jgi:glyoxylase-like metal-dependent hydrolase (beta-lactamase superfamily II)
LTEALESFHSQLAEIGASIQDIHTVILTHCHIDHMGMVPRLKKMQPIQVYLHLKDLELMRIRYTGVDNFVPMTDRFLQTHGFPANELTPPEFQLPMPDDMHTIVPDVLMRGGDKLTVGDYHFSVIETPGHTPGHVAFFEAEHRFLISGDMLLPTIATNAAFHVQHIENPLRLYLNSLESLRVLDFDTVLPGHEQVFTNPRARIDELVRNHAQKAGVILNKMADGQSKTAYQVSRELAVSSRTGISHWPNMTGWEKRFAVLQTIAHLKSLEFDHQISSDLSGEIRCFKASPGRAN